MLLVRMRTPLSSMDSYFMIKKAKMRQRNARAPHLRACKMYSSLRETLLVTSLTDSLLLLTLTRTDARSAGEETSAVPVTRTSLTRLLGASLPLDLFSSSVSLSLLQNSQPAAAGITATTRLEPLIVGEVQKHFPAAERTERVA